MGFIFFFSFTLFFVIAKCFDNVTVNQSYCVFLTLKNKERETPEEICLLLVVVFILFDKESRNYFCVCILEWQFFRVRLRPFSIFLFPALSPLLSISFKKRYHLILQELRPWIIRKTNKTQLLFKTPAIYASKHTSTHLLLTHNITYNTPTLIQRNSRHLHCNMATGIWYFRTKYVFVYIFFLPFSALSTFHFFFMFGTVLLVKSFCVNVKAGKNGERRGESKVSTHIFLGGSIYSRIFRKWFSFGWT